MKRALGLVLISGPLIAAGVASAGVLAYAIWNHSRLLDGPAKVVCFGIAPAMALIGVLGLVRCSTAIRARAVLLLCSLAVPVYAAEVMLGSGVLARIVKARELAIKEKELSSQGREWDARSKRQVVLDERAQGKNAVPTVHSCLFYLGHQQPPLVHGAPVIPLGGISNCPTAYCNEGGRFVLYESDEHGFRNPRGLYRPGKLDLAAVGDSFVQGACVCDSTDLLARIRKDRPRSLNLGSGGNGPLSNLAAITEYAIPLRPAWVVWFHCEANDLSDLAMEEQSLLVRYLEPAYSAGLMDCQPEIDHALRAIVEEELRHSQEPGLTRGGHGGGRTLALKDILFLRNLRNRLGLAGTKGSERSDLDPTLARFAKVLKTARERVASHGGRMLFVYLPEYHRYEGTYDDEPRRAVLKLVRDLEIPSLDVVEVFAQVQDPKSLFPFSLPGHYNERGYRLVAEAVLARLTGFSAGSREPSLNR